MPTESWFWNCSRNLAITVVLIAVVQVSKYISLLGSHILKLVWYRFAAVEYASYNIGVFLCTQCAGIHRGLGVDVSKIKHLKLDKWEDSQVQRMDDVGNIRGKHKYEERVPACYRRPNEDAPQ